MSVPTHPHFRMAYVRGSNAASRGEGEHRNPYKNEGYEKAKWKTWNEGWLWWRASQGLEKKRKL